VGGGVPLRRRNALRRHTLSLVAFLRCRVAPILPVVAPVLPVVVPVLLVVAPVLPVVEPVLPVIAPLLLVVVLVLLPARQKQRRFRPSLGAASDGYAGVGRARRAAGRVNGRVRLYEVARGRRAPPAGRPP
jgi:hypothetical protein